jgi:hypothetical protein
MWARLFDRAARRVSFLGGDRSPLEPREALARLVALADCSPTCDEPHCGGHRRSLSRTAGGRPQIGLQDSCHFRNGLGVWRESCELIARVGRVRRAAKRGCLLRGRGLLRARAPQSPCARARAAPRRDRRSQPGLLPAAAAGGQAPHAEDARPPSCRVAGGHAVMGTMGYVFPAARATEGVGIYRRSSIRSQTPSGGRPGARGLPVHSGWDLVRALDVCVIVCITWSDALGWSID